MKKVKKYIWFVLVSCLCSFITGHKQQTASGKTTFRFGFPLANAKWCPKGTEFLDSDGECCAGSFDRRTGRCNDGICGWGKFWGIEYDDCLECDAVSHWRGGYHVWSGIAPKDCRKCGYKIYGSYCVNDECGADEFWSNEEQYCMPCDLAINPSLGYSRLSASACQKCGYYPENGYCFLASCSSVAWFSGLDHYSGAAEICKACGYEVKGSYCVPKDACKADEFWNASGGCTSCSGYNVRPIGSDYGMMTSEDCKKCGMIEENGFCVRTRGYTTCPDGQAFIYPWGCSVPQLDMRGYAIGSEISKADCKKVGGYVVNGSCVEPPSDPVSLLGQGPSNFEMVDSSAVCGSDSFWCPPMDQCMSFYIDYGNKQGYLIGGDITEFDCNRLGGYVAGGYCYPTNYNCAEDKFWNPLYKQCTPTQNLAERTKYGLGYAIGSEISENECKRLSGYIAGGYCFEGDSDSSIRCGSDSFWNRNVSSCYNFYPDYNNKRGYKIGSEISQSDCVRLNGYVAGGYCYPTNYGCAMDQFWNISSKKCVQLTNNELYGGQKIGEEISEDDCKKLGKKIFNDWCAPECGMNGFFHGIEGKCVYDWEYVNKSYAVGIEISKVDCEKVGGTIQNRRCIIKA